MTVDEANGVSLKVADGKATLALADGERTWTLLEGQWPNADEILAGAKAGNKPFAVNPALLAQVGKAISDDGKPAALTLNPVAPLKPIWVGNGRSDVAALVMPVHSAVTGWPADLADALADDEKLGVALKAAAAQLANRRGQKRAVEAFRKALGA